MARRLLVPALSALVALPAASQAVAQQSADAATTAPAPAIDPALVGTWELVEVEHHGTLQDLDATVEVMACEFGADGAATVRMTIEQDADRYARDREFRFTAADGRIQTEGTDHATYELIGTDEVRLTMVGGFVARLRRVDA